MMLLDYFWGSVRGYALMLLVVPGIVAAVIHLWAILDAATFKSNE